MCWGRMIDHDTMSDQRVKCAATERTSEVRRAAFDSGEIECVQPVSGGRSCPCCEIESGEA